MRRKAARVAAILAVLVLAYEVERVGGAMWLFVASVAAILAYVGGSAVWDVWGRGRGDA